MLFVKSINYYLIICNQVELYFDKIFIQFIRFTLAITQADTSVYAEENCRILSCAIFIHGDISEKYKTQFKRVLFIMHFQRMSVHMGSENV